jgi:hypothetical protein
MTTKNNDVLTGNVADPKLTLYAFHLKHNFAQGMDNKVKDAEKIWKKIQEFGTKHEIDELKKLDAIIPEKYQNNKPINSPILPNILEFASKNDNKLKGEFNPRQIHDTYAIDLTLRYPDQKLQLNHLKGLNPNDSLLPSKINASLGQSLVFFAQPIGNIYDDKTFADVCVKSFLSEGEKTFEQLELNFQHQGKLLGSPIFEYNNDADSPEKQCHILIWLNTNPQTTILENEGKYYDPLIKLLNCRSKIIYARSQATWCYQQARKEYRTLERKAILFNRLKKKHIDLQLRLFNKWLNEIQKTSFNYARYLRDLQQHNTTIQSDIKNYHLNLDTLKIICVKEDNLEFLLSFVEFAKDTFVEQINTDLAYLTPGQNFFDQMLNTIRGIVEVEQAKRDRSLERTIQVLGIAFGGGAIVSGVVTEHIDKPFAQQINFKYPVHPLVLSLLWSLLATVVFGMVAWLVTKPKHKRTKGK